MNIDERISLIDFDRRIIITVLGFILILLFSLFVILEMTSISNNSIEAKAYTAKSKVLENDLKYNMSSINDDFTTKGLQKIFTQDDLTVFANGYWTYQLYVNDILVTSNSLSVTATSANINVSVIETEKESVLPKQVIDMGRLTGNDKKDTIATHFSISNQNYPVKESTSKLVNTYTIQKPVIKKGETFQIVLSDQLMEKLNLGNNMINVTVK